MEVNIKEISFQERKMAMVLKLLQKELLMKANFKMIKCMVKENILLKIDILIKVSFKMMILKAKAIVFGLLEKNILVNGKIIKCMDKENLLGQIRKLIKVF